MTNVFPFDQQNSSPSLVRRQCPLRVSAFDLCRDVGGGDLWRRLYVLFCDGLLVASRTSRFVSLLALAVGSGDGCGFGGNGNGCVAWNGGVSINSFQVG